MKTCPPRVTSVVPAAELTEVDVLRLAASLERSSEHPLAAAVMAAAKAKGITTTKEPTAFASVTGKGVTGKVGGRLVALGNAKLMADQSVEMGDLAAKADALRGSGATTLFVAVAGSRAASSPSPIRSRRPRGRRPTPSNGPRPARCPSGFVDGQG